MTVEEIRSRYLSRLRSLYRLIRRLESLYCDFPDAPPDVWRKAICSAAAYVKSAPDTELIKMAGSHIALRNLVSDEVGLDRTDGEGGSYGNRVLDINWD